MFEAIQTFKECPKCDGKLIKCVVELFICPKCKSVFISAKRGKKVFLRKTSKESEKMCREILDSGKWKPLQTVKEIIETESVDKKAHKLIADIYAYLDELKEIIDGYKKKQKTIEEIFNKIGEFKEAK